MRFKRLLKFPSCHSYLNKGKAGNSFLTYLRSRRKNSHFSGISHAQTPAMATRINLLSLDQVSRSSEYPLLRNSENIQNFKLLRGSPTINFDTAGQRFTEPPYGEHKPTQNKSQTRPQIPAWGHVRVSKSANDVKSSTLKP